MTGQPLSLRAAAGAPWQRAWMRVRARWEDTTSRFIWKSCDALLTAGLGQSNTGEPVASLENAGSPRYRRAQQVVNALARLLPRAAERYRRKLLAPGLLPFAAEPATLFSYGSGVTAFLVRVGAEPLVLKVYRKSLGKPLAALHALLHEQRANYQRLLSWYDGCSVLLPTQFLILHGPLRAGAASACVQPYIEGPHRDVFDDITERALLQLLAEQPRLEAQFRRFVERTLQAAEREGACVDLVGRNNLVIVGTGPQCRLMLLDNGLYDFARKAVQSPAALAEVRRRIAYLERVYLQLDGGELPVVREQQCPQTA